MPSACKVYELGEADKLPLLREALKPGAEAAGAKLTLTESGGLSLRGVAELAGRAVVFEVFGFKGKLYLIVAAGKKLARRVAAGVAEAAGLDAREVEVPSRRISGLCEGRVVKLVVFGMVRVPGLRRVMLTGDAVSDTDIYRELSQLSEVKYAVFEDESGVLLGVSDRLSVVAYSKLTDEELIELVKERLLPSVIQ